MDLDQLRQIVIQANQEEAESQFNPEVVEEARRERPRRHGKINTKFCIPWDTLEIDLQINRVIEFVKRFQEDNDLTSATAKKVRKLLITAICNREKLEVVYDQTLGQIVAIPKLYYRDETGYFLGTYLNQNGSLVKRVSKISQIQEGEEKDKIMTEDYQPKPKMNLRKKT